MYKLPDVIDVILSITNMQIQIMHRAQNIMNISTKILKAQNIKKTGQKRRNKENRKKIFTKKGKK